MGHWAKPELDPDHTLIFYPTLRESLAADHPVHLTDEILRSYDWSRWEAEYVLVEGQPPIHPRHFGVRRLDAAFRLRLHRSPAVRRTEKNFAEQWGQRNEERTWSVLFRLNCRSSISRFDIPCPRGRMRARRQKRSRKPTCPS